MRRKVPMIFPPLGRRAPLNVHREVTGRAAVQLI